MGIAIEVSLTPPPPIPLPPSLSIMFELRIVFHVSLWDNNKHPICYIYVGTISLSLLSPSHYLPPSLFPYLPPSISISPSFSSSLTPPISLFSLYLYIYPYPYPNPSHSPSPHVKLVTILITHFILYRTIWIKSISTVEAWTISSSIKWYC